MNHHYAEYDTNYNICINKITKKEFDAIVEMISEIFGINSSCYEEDGDSWIYTDTADRCVNTSNFRDEIFKTVGRPISGSITETSYGPQEYSERFGPDDFRAQFSNSRRRRLERMV